MKNIKTQDNKNRKDVKPKFKICRVVTCVHNIDNRCMLDECELYERQLRQEY
jgi:hypothetical protein